MLYVLSICQLSEQAKIFVASIHPQTLVCLTSSKRCLRFLAARVGGGLGIDGETKVKGVLTMDLYCLALCFEWVDPRIKLKHFD